MVVSEIASDTRMAIESVTVNSWNNRPRMPPISKIGMNTAIKERLIESTVNPTSRAPRKAASMRGIPSSRCREMFSITTIASSTTKPVAMVSAIKDKMSRL